MHHQLDLSHTELVAVYVALARHEADLDETQTKLFERLSSMLYARLSVSDMEDIESYYRTLSGHG